MARPSPFAAYLGSALLAAAIAAPAFADSPDPLEDTTYTVVAQDANSITVELNGSWQFKRECGERLVGWEVDWDDDSDPGHEIVDGIDVGSRGLSGLNEYDNTVDLDPDNCVEGAHMGTWGPIRHTYSKNTAQTEARPCVVVYDVKEKKIGDDGKHSDVAGGEDRNKDNSAEDNQNEEDEGCFADIIIDISDRETPECDDGIDNDGDGKVDYPADPGCSSKNDDDESDLPECSDGIDNDGDGKADADDPGCLREDGTWDPNDDDESDLPQCRDGIDNDGDGNIDYPADSGCDSPEDPDERAQCSDEIDNDGDGKADADDPGCLREDGTWDPEDNDETNLPQCSDGIDNDGDGKVDYPADPGCSSKDDDDERDSPPNDGTCFGFAADVKATVEGDLVNADAGYLRSTKPNEFPNQKSIDGSVELTGDDGPFLTAGAVDLENAYGELGECTTRSTLAFADFDADNLAPLPDVPSPLNPINFSAQVLEANAAAACGEDAEGSVTILNGVLNIDGQSIPIESNPGANTEVIGIGPLLGTEVMVVLNEQIETSNGIEVNAVHITGTVNVPGVTNDGSISHNVDVVIGHAEAGVEDCQ